MFAAILTAGLVPGWAMACQLNSTDISRGYVEPTQIQGSGPVDICLGPDKTGIRFDQRVVLAVTQFEPPGEGKAALHVSIPLMGEQVFGIFPHQAFGAGDVGKHRRYLLLSSGDRPGTGADKPFCVSVRLAPGDGGSVTVHLERRAVGG